MQYKQRVPWYHFVTLTLLLLAFLLWLMMAQRSFLFFSTLALIPLVAFVRSLRRKAWAVLGLLFALSLVPIEITFRDVPGPPRLVPYSAGLLSKEGREAEARGEFVAGSDLVMLDAAVLPKWAWVW